MTGLDISPRLLAIARDVTAGRFCLVEAHAAVWKSPAPFDIVVSRFGPMFFDDPQAGFYNIARMLKPGGELVFCCWRAAKENAWVTAPMAAVRDLLPKPAVTTDVMVEAGYAAGPSGLADIGFVRSLIETSGLPP